MTVVRTIDSSAADAELLRRRIAQIRVRTGTLGGYNSFDRDIVFRFDLAPGDATDFGIRMEVGPERAPVVERWRDEGFGREPIDLLTEALDGALASDAVREIPEDLVLAMLGMASTLVGGDEEAIVVVRCPTPWAPAHVMIGSEETTSIGSRFAYRLVEPDPDVRRLLAVLPMATHLATDHWSTSLSAIDVRYEPGDLDPMTRLRALSAWASWRD